MNRWVRIWCIVWLTAAGLFAAPLLDEPVDKLTLQDGTVLREALAKGFLTKVVLVRCQDGVRTVPYELFPEEFRAVLAIKRQAALAAVEQQAQIRESQEAAKPRSTPSATGTKWEMQPACRLSVSGTRGDVIVLRIENLSDFVAAMYPWQIVERTRTGRLLSGTHWVSLNEEGRVVMTLRSRQLIDGHSALTLELVVSPGLGEDVVESVLWR